MTIDLIFKELARCVRKGEVTFIQRAVTSVAGNVNFWVEAIHPKIDTSPMEYLSVQEFLPEDPPYGLSWDDYRIMVNASHGSDGEGDPWRLELIKACKADLRVRFLDE